LRGTHARQGTLIRNLIGRLLLIVFVFLGVAFGAPAVVFVALLVVCLLVEAYAPNSNGNMPDKSRQVKTETAKQRCGCCRECQCKFLKTLLIDSTAF
jgi:hypothetical protein